MHLPLLSYFPCIDGKRSRALLTGLLLLAGSAVQAQVDNYTFVGSTGTYSALPATATRVTAVQTDDAGSAALPLGFTFTFDGTPYTSVKASSNCFLTFNAASSASSLSNDLDAGSASDRPLVAPYWDDMHGGQGTASYLTTGTAPNRVFTFEWLNWYRFGNSGGPTLSMQVQLFEGTNVVRFVYRQETAGVFSGASASIGLSGAGMGSGSFLSLSNASAAPNVSSTMESDMIADRPATGQVYSFTPPVPSACPTPRNLTATVNGTTANVSWTVTGGGGTFSVIYGPTGFNPATGGTTVGPFTGTTAAISGLVPGSYQFYVRQNCPGTAGMSSLSSAGGFSVPCPVPTALAVTTLTNTTATLTWNSPVTTGATFTVIYGPPGINPVSGGTRVPGVIGTTYTITNLTAATNYVAYVTQSCLGGLNSAMPAGPVNFTTPLTAPNNDEPCGAIALGTGTVAGSNSGASTSLQPGIVLPACSPSQVPQDVWFTITPSGTSTTLTFTGNAAGMVRVFTSPSCSAGPFTQVFCAGSASNTSVGTVNVTGLTARQRYYVAVSGFGSADTPGTFTIAGSALLASRGGINSAALQVYPNPSGTGQLALRLPAGPAAGTLELLNALGQQVRQQALTGAAEQTLSTRGLAAGVYTLRLLRGAEVLTKKVVLE